jgi:hypothetical protein
VLREELRLLGVGSVGGVDDQAIPACAAEAVSRSNAAATSGRMGLPLHYLFGAIPLSSNP